MLAPHDRLAAFRNRRGVIKTRLVKLAGKGLDGATAHLRYIQRDGVTREGQPGALYDRCSDQADGKAFLERSSGDRHQFRLIVSAEDASSYEDLKPVVRRLMIQLEEDLGSRLEWVAVDHFNTGHPHTHIILRGKDDRGQNLVIGREYIAHGMRARFEQLLSLDLGPRTDLEIARRLQHDVAEERLTPIDRSLIARLEADRTLRPSRADPHFHSLEVARLRNLERLSLAREVVPGRWQLVQGFPEHLQALGERGDIVRTLQRELTRAGLDHTSSEQRVHRLGDLAQPLVGRLVARGLSDELKDRHYLVIAGLDGRSHYVDIGPGEALERIGADAIVRLSTPDPEPRASDHIIAEIAAAHGQRYSAALHKAHDPGASDDFVAAHVRRLEATRKLSGSPQRDADGTWTITYDHLEYARRFEAEQARHRPLFVEILSSAPLPKLIGVEAATWLDRQLVTENPGAPRDCGFGKEVRSALALRRQWLIEQGLAENTSGGTAYRRHLLHELERREILRTAQRLSSELGLDFVAAPAGTSIGGRLSRKVDLISGRYGLVERSRDFSLVPWRPVLERHLGREIHGLVRSSGISWTLGRGRQGSNIS